MIDRIDCENMNAFDYLFSSSKNLARDFVSGLNEHVSFKELYSDSLGIAAYLRNTAGENKHILLVSTNSAFFISAYLGIIKSGNICIPINPSIEQANLDYIINITNCHSVFLADDFNSALTISHGKVIRKSEINNILLNIQLKARDNRREYFDSNRIALILFTSGSTDIPKGVMLSHLNISSNTESIIKYLKLSSEDVIGVVLPFYYCYGLSLLHTHLKVGGALVLINNFIFLGSVINDLKKFKCTGFAGVPSHFQILLRKSQTFSSTEFPDLRYVTQAGGKLHDVFITEFIQSFPRVAFFVMYGQTEATARLAYLPPELLSRKLGSIGRQIPGVTLKILNEHFQPVEVGEVGEIAAKGENVMKGYFNDPDATKETLNAGWLLTGDLATMDSEGFIYLVGRKKEIIKVGGRRISPKEIEGVILTVSEVIDCTVEGIYDEILGEAIQATIVLKAGCDELTLKEKILKRCNTKLSSFKIPQSINFESSIKVNSSGKKVKRVTIPK